VGRKTKIIGGIIGAAFLIFILVILFTPASPLEKEIKYYQERGYPISETTILEFYDSVPIEAETREVEVSKTELRERASYTRESFDRCIVWTDGEILWVLWLPEGSEVIQVSYWRP